MKPRSKIGSMIAEMPAETTGTQRLGESLNLRSVIDMIPALVVCALPDGTVEFINQGWREYAGSSLEQLTGWGWQSRPCPYSSRQGDTILRICS